MNKKQKFALAFIVAIIAVATVVVANLSKQTKNTSQNATTFNQNAVPRVSQSVPTQNVVSGQLQPLPTDNRQAIDSELDNIDKELKTTDNTINSNDLSDANLGL